MVIGIGQLSSAVNVPNNYILTVVKQHFWIIFLFHFQSRSIFSTTFIEFIEFEIVLIRKCDMGLQRERLRGCSFECYGINAQHDAEASMLTAVGCLLNRTAVVCFASDSLAAIRCIVFPLSPVSFWIYNNTAMPVETMTIATTIVSFCSGLSRLNFPAMHHVQCETVLLDRKERHS